MKKIYRRDEEPEQESVNTWGMRGCTWCGHEDHETKQCPIRLEVYVTSGAT